MKRNTLLKQAAAGLALATFIGGSLPALADSTLTAEQIVNITVDEIQQISTSGAATLHITTAVAGQAPTEVYDDSTTYSITSNDGVKKITAAIDTAMPEGMALNLTATAPTGGTSTGEKTLTTLAQDLVTGVTLVSETKALAYELTATAAAGKLAADVRTVTFTIAAAL